MGRSRQLTPEQARQQAEISEFLDLAEIFRAMAKKHECGDPRAWVPLFETYLKAWPGAGKPLRRPGRQRAGAAGDPAGEGRGSGRRQAAARVGDILPDVTESRSGFIPLGRILEDLAEDDPLDGLELSPEDLRKLDDGEEGNEAAKAGQDPPPADADPDPDPGE